MKRVLFCLICLLVLSACSNAEEPSVTTPDPQSASSTTTADSASAVVNTTTQTPTSTTPITTSAATATTTEGPVVTESPIPTYPLPLSEENAAAMIEEYYPDQTVVEVITTGKYYYVFAETPAEQTQFSCEECAVAIHAIVIESGTLCETNERYPELFEVAAYGILEDRLIIWQHDPNPYHERARSLPKYTCLSVNDRDTLPRLGAQNSINEYYSEAPTWLPVGIDWYDYGYPMGLKENGKPMAILYDCNAGYDDLALCFGFDDFMMAGDERAKVPLMSFDYDNNVLTLIFEHLQNRIVSDGDLGLSNRFIDSVRYQTVGDGAVITLQLTDEACVYTTDLRIVRNKTAEEEKYANYQTEGYALGNYCILFSLRFAHDCSYQVFPAEMTAFCPAA